MKPLFAAVLIVSCSAAHAESKIPLKVIQPLVHTYLEAIGCSGGVNPNQIARFSDPDTGIRGFIAVASSDIICAGGSGTWAPTVVFVRTAGGREGMEDPGGTYLRVDPLLSEPVAHSLNASRDVARIYEHHGEVYAVGLDYRESDGNCCPSVRSLSQIKLVKEVTAAESVAPRPMYTWVFSAVKK